MKLFVLDSEIIVEGTYNSYLSTLKPEITTTFFKEYAEFFQKLKKETPDFIIMDYIKNTPNARSVVEKIRGLLPNIPIVIISAFLTEDIIIGLHRFNISKFLDKPLDGQQFLTTMKSVIQMDSNGEQESIPFQFPTIKKPKILILEDISSMYLLYKTYLGKYFEIERIKNFKELKLYADKNSVEVIIMDYALHFNDIANESYNHILHYVLINYPESIRVLISGYVETYDLSTTYSKYFHIIAEKPLPDYNEFVNDLLKLVNSKKHTEEANLL